MLNDGWRSYVVRCNPCTRAAGCMAPCRLIMYCWTRRVRCILSPSAPYRSKFAQHPWGCAMESVRRSEEHTSELQSLMRISYADCCLKINTLTQTTKHLR